LTNYNDQGLTEAATYIRQLIVSLWNYNGITNKTADGDI